MKTLIKHTFVNGWELSSSGEPADRNGRCQLIVNVIFTDAKSTQAALRSAQMLARDLGARIRVLAPYVVPFGCSLDHPPIAIGFLERLLADLVSEEVPGPTETTVHLYLCRDRLDTLGQVLEPHSLVVIGGKRWWPDDARWVARMLRALGHRVIHVTNLPAYFIANQHVESECSAKSCL
jgi:hypothetical protein